MTGRSKRSGFACSQARQGVAPCRDWSGSSQACACTPCAGTAQQDASLTRMAAWPHDGLGRFNCCSHIARPVDVLTRLMCGSITEASACMHSTIPATGLSHCSAVLGQPAQLLHARMLASRCLIQSPQNLQLHAEGLFTGICTFAGPPPAVLRHHVLRFAAHTCSSPLPSYTTLPAACSCSTAAPLVLAAAMPMPMSAPRCPSCIRGREPS